MEFLALCGCPLCWVAAVVRAQPRHRAARISQAADVAPAKSKFCAASRRSSRKNAQSLGRKKLNRRRRSGTNASRRIGVRRRLSTLDRCASGLVLERRNLDVQDWKDEVIAAERLLARQERLELALAMGTGNRARCDDGNEERRFADRFSDFSLPHLSRCDCLYILPTAKILQFAAREQRCEVPSYGGPDRGQLAPEIFIVLARVAEEAHELRKFGQRSHGALRSRL